MGEYQANSAYKQSQSKELTPGSRTQEEQKENDFARWRHDSPLGFLAGGDVGRVLLRLTARHAQRAPLSGFHRGEMLGGEYDLPDMLGVVTHLTIDGLHHGVRFRANLDSAVEVRVRQSFEGPEENFPTGFPQRQQLSSARGRRLEFRVAIAVGLFAVGGQEVRPARLHVAGEVFDDGGDGVGFGIQRGKQAFVRALLQGAIAKLLVGVKKTDRIPYIRCRELVRHELDCTLGAKTVLVIRFLFAYIRAAQESMNLGGCHVYRRNAVTGI